VMIEAGGAGVVGHLGCRRRNVWSQLDRARNDATLFYIAPVFRIYRPDPAALPAISGTKPGQKRVLRVTDHRADNAPSTATPSTDSASTPASGRRSAKSVP